jgi:hypothetical protein
LRNYTKTFNKTWTDVAIIKKQQLSRLSVSRSLQKFLMENSKKTKSADSTTEITLKVTTEPDRKSMVTKNTDSKRI